MANIEFDVSISGDWITGGTTRSLSSTMLSFEIAENRSYVNREGAITINQKGGILTSTIKVYQSQEDAIILSNKTEDISNESQTQEVELKTNVNFEVIIPKDAKSWVPYSSTRALRTKTLILNIAENVSYEARKTEIYVMNKETSLQDTLSINQSPNSGLIVTQDKYELSNDAATIEVEVKANVDFDVFISKDWISKITTRGLASNKLNLYIAKSESYDNRSGSIISHKKDGTLSSTININQSQEDAIILSNNTAYLSSDMQTLEIEFKTNVDVEVIIPAAARSWVSYNPTRALRTETLLINIAVNEKNEARSTMIYIKDMSTNIQNMFFINQSANTKPLLISPANNLTNANRLPTFRWSEMTNSDGQNFSYRIEYSDNLVSWQHSFTINDNVFNLSDCLVFPYKHLFN